MRWSSASGADKGNQMITVQLYDGSGNKRTRVSLSLRKSTAGNRILEALQQGKPGWTLTDLTRLDAGSLAFDKAASLFDGDELETAISNRIDEIHGESAELEALKALLHSGAWTGARGGEGSGRSREATLRGNWKEVVSGARKSLSSQPETLFKSRAMSGTSAADILTAHNWERTDGDQGTDVFTHGKLKGRSVHVGKDESWEHRAGQKVLGKSERDDPPIVAVATLNAELMRHYHRG
jgi:hypothetical protein